jgi:hypothetical protein
MGRTRRNDWNSLVVRGTEWSDRFCGFDNTVPQRRVCAAILDRRVLAVRTGEGRDDSPEFGAPSGDSSVSSISLAGCLRPIRRAIPSPIRHPTITREAQRRTGRERLATVSTFSTTSSQRSISDSSSCAVSTRSWASDSNAAKSLTCWPPASVDRWTAHGCLRFTLGRAVVRVSPNSGTGASVSAATGAAR